MKVRVNYNVNIEEVTGHISDLMTKLGDKISHSETMAHETAHCLNSGKNSGVVLDIINRLRLSLAEIDSNLADYSVILAQTERAQMDNYLKDRESLLEHRELTPSENEDLRLLLENDEGQALRSPTLDHRGPVTEDDIQRAICEAKEKHREEMKNDGQTNTTDRDTKD